MDFFYLIQFNSQPVSPSVLKMRWLVSLCVVCGSRTTNGLADYRPNIVFLLADDLGWNGLSVPMHPTVAE